MNDAPTPQEMAAIAAALNLAYADSADAPPRSNWAAAARREAIGGQE